jgi:hypothetical protein
MSYVPRSRQRANRCHRIHRIELGRRSQYCSAAQAVADEQGRWRIIARQGTSAAHKRPNKGTSGISILQP